MKQAIVVALVALLLAFLYALMFDIERAAAHPRKPPPIEQAMAHVAAGTPTRGVLQAMRRVAAGTSTRGVEQAMARVGGTP